MNSDIQLALEHLQSIAEDPSSTLTKSRAELAIQVLNRLNSPTASASEIDADFIADLQRSRAKHPGNKRLFDATLGEIHELKRAYKGDGDVRAEAFDVAVCAYRIATEGDGGDNEKLNFVPDWMAWGQDHPQIDGYMRTVHELQKMAKNAPYVTQEYIFDVAAMEPSEMRRRLIRSYDWSGHFTHCLDGIPEIQGMPGSGIDGCRMHKEVRAVVTGLIEQINRLKAKLNEQQIDLDESHKDLQLGKVIEGLQDSRNTIASSNAFSPDEKHEINKPLLEAQIFLRATARILNDALEGSDEKTS